MVFVLGFQCGFGSKFASLPVFEQLFRGPHSSFDHEFAHGLVGLIPMFHSLDPWFVSFLVIAS